MDAILSTQGGNGERETDMGKAGQESSSRFSTSSSNGIEVDINMGNSKDGENLWMNTEQTVIIILQMILLIFLCIFGTVANSLVFWVFNRRPALRSLSNRFVLSLVTANILISSIIAPLILFETILNEYFLLPCISDVISTMSSSVIFSAVFSTLLIATDRFYAVTSPLHYSMTITRSRSQVMIIVAWLSGIILALPYVLLCSITHQSDFQRSLHITFTIIQITIGYALPFIGLCWLYIRMSIESHKNCLRTRKHSISGELLTVMDGSTSVIPQGIDFLTHYINPFTRTQMAGSVPVGNNHRNSVGQVVPVVKKSRRRSSNGSSSSLLFREEGRAIKTAFFVLASFFVCWTPHFALMLINEISEAKSLEQFVFYRNVTLVEMEMSLGGSLAIRNERDSALHHQNLTSPFYSNKTGSDWAKFLGVFGMLLSSVLNPFIYVFRNKIACEEISRLLYAMFGFKLLSKDEFHHQQPPTNADKDRKSSYNGTGVANPIMNDPPNLYDDHGLPTGTPNYQPRYAPCVGKSPKRSSMKSLTPQSSINSTMTNCNSMNGAPTDSPIINRPTDSTHVSFCNGRPSKPPFIRSLTVPEQQTQPRVKFPPNLVRQKSYASYRPPTTVSMNTRGVNLEVTPATSKRAKFVRQDSVCSILSNDSVLMICSEDGIPEVGPLGILNLSLPSHPIGNGTCPRGAADPTGGEIGSTTISRVPESDNEDDICTSQIHSISMQGTPVAKCYIRQDSNYSDRTNDSGIVLSSICSNSTKHSDTLSNSHTNTPEHLRNLRQVSPIKSPVRNARPQQQPQSQPPNHCKRDVCVVTQGHYAHSTHNGHTHSHERSRQSSPVVPNNSIIESNDYPSRHSPLLLQTSI